MLPLAVGFRGLCVHVCLLLILDAVGSSHDPVGSNQRSPTSVPPNTVLLILQRNLETNKGQAGCKYTERAHLVDLFQKKSLNNRILRSLWEFNKQMLNLKCFLGNLKTLTDVSTLAYLPGPAVRLGIFSIDHTGCQGLNGWGAAPESWMERK